MHTTVNFQQLKIMKSLSYPLDDQHPVSIIQMKVAGTVPAEPDNSSNWIQNLLHHRAVSQEEIRRNNHVHYRWF